jgi:hypothetical protein
MEFIKSSLREIQKGECGAQVESGGKESIFLFSRCFKTYATLKFHLTPVKITIIKNTTTNNAGEDVGKKEPSYTAGGSIN